MEEVPRFELGIKDLQSSALPLGYAAVTSESIASMTRCVKKRITAMQWNCGSLSNNSRKKHGELKPLTSMDDFRLRELTVKLLHLRLPAAVCKSESFNTLRFLEHGAVSKHDHIHNSIT